MNQQYQGYDQLRFGIFYDNVAELTALLLKF